MQDNVLVLKKDSFVDSRRCKMLLDGELSYTDITYSDFKIDREEWMFSNIVMLFVEGNTYILRNRYGGEGIVVEKRESSSVRSRDEILELRRKFRNTKDLLLISGGITQGEILAVDNVISWFLNE